MKPGRWVWVRGMENPTMALEVEGRREQWVSYGPTGWWVRWPGMDWRRAEPGEIPPVVRDAVTRRAS